MGETRTVQISGRSWDNQGRKIAVDEDKKLVFETLRAEIQEGVAVLTVDRPSALNSLNSKVLEEMDRCLEALAQDRRVAALVITGRGGRAFVAGADISEMAAMTEKQAREFSDLGQRVFARLRWFQGPVIAAVNGYALGGGNELAMACDVRIAAQNARFGQPEVGLGITPGFGGTQILPRLVGPVFALELIMTGRVIDAQEAFRVGLVHKVVPEGEALKESLELAREITWGKSRFAVAQAKKAVWEGLSRSFQDGLFLEQRLFGECFRHPDQEEGMEAFLEKRKPDFWRYR